MKRKLEVDAEIDRTVPPEFRSGTSTGSDYSALSTAFCRPHFLRMRIDCGDSSWKPRPPSTPHARSARGIFNPKDGMNDIWIYDLPRATFTRFTFEPGLENSPLWSPDGQKIVYAHDRDGPPHLFLKRVSDSGEAEMLLPTGDGPQTPYDWSPDGQHLIYRTYGLLTKSDLFILPLTGERKPVPFIQTPFNESDARLSPDGKWLAYVSDQSGRREVYVDRFPGGASVRKSLTPAAGLLVGIRMAGNCLFGGPEADGAAGEERRQI